MFQLKELSGFKAVEQKIDERRTAKEIAKRAVLVGLLTVLDAVIQNQIAAEVKAATIAENRRTEKWYPEYAALLTKAEHEGKAKRKRGRPRKTASVDRIAA